MVLGPPVEGLFNIITNLTLVLLQGPVCSLDSDLTILFLIVTAHLEENWPLPTIQFEEDWAGG